MKIAVCGKGGSGKSIVTALLANGAQRKGYHVLVVDSDESNFGLHRMLGFDRPPAPLMDLLGGKKGLKEKMGQPEVLAQAHIWVEDIPPEYMIGHDGLKLVAIGKIMQSLEGCACPMGVLSREFLRKLHLKHNEIAIVDMEAGIEHFGRGVETSVDNVLIVVEPSFESLHMAGRIKSLATASGINNTCAVLNKIASDSMDFKLREELRKNDMNVIGSIHYESELFQDSLDGHPLRAGKSAQEMETILDHLFAANRVVQS